MAEYVDKKHIYDLFEGTNGVIRLHVAEVDILPAADVDPVVRCKDCKHGDAFDGNAVVIWCPYYEDQPVDPDHFCGYGERKDSEA